MLEGASMSGRVLVVDDERTMVALLTTGLGKRGYAVVARTSAEDALAALREDDIDVVVTDLNMPHMNGLELCRRIVENRPDVPVIVLSAFGSFETAVEAIRAGAYDFVTKPVQLEPLTLSIERAIQHRALRAEVRELRRTIEAERGFGDLVGKSPAMAAVNDLVERVGASDASVLITGESGTGKEVVARALHRKSRREGGPFVAINCAAVPESLIESELFGHVRGAFTDARADKKGLFREAHKGTLFLDEIGELSLGVQAKLLRVLQERTVRPVGGSTETPFDARVIAATNRDLEVAVEEKRFREDLFFRINVVQVALPPLRARGVDVLLLAQHFLARFAAREGKAITGLTAATAQKLMAYAWPGNVRELQNAMERAVALTRFAEISVEDLPEKVSSYRSSHVLVTSDDPSELVPLEEVERRYILKVVDAVTGNRSMAARILGLDRKTLRRKLTQYGVQGESEPSE